MATTTSASATPAGNVLGPLTTTWTAPPACAVAIVQCASSCAKGFLGQQCASQIPGAGCSDATTCWPSAIVTGATWPLLGWGYYSPGTICPSGYVSACTATSDGFTGWTQQFNMKEQETAVGCCPSGFGCAFESGVQSCYSYASSGASIAVGTCRSGTTEAFSYLTMSSSISTTNVNARMKTFTAQAPLVGIRWRSSDLPASVTVVTPTSGTSATASSVSTSHSNTGLSTGAIIAIAVVIPVGILLLLAVAFFWWRRKKHNNSVLHPSMEALSKNHSNTVKAAAYSDSASTPAHELAATAPNELDSNQAKHEMDTGRPVQELPG